MFKRVFKYILVIVMFIIIGKVDAKVLTLDEVREEVDLIEEPKKDFFGEDFRMGAIEYISEDNSIVFDKRYLEYSAPDIDIDEIKEQLLKEKERLQDITRAILNLSGYEDYTLKEQEYRDTYDDYGYEMWIETNTLTQSEEIVYYKISLDTDKIGDLVDEYGVKGCFSETVMHYVVKYDVDGGEEIDEDDFYDMATYKFPTPTKEGYTFGGWYLDKDFKSKVEKIDDVDFERVTSEDECSNDSVATLYAKWLKDEVDVDDTKVNLNISIILISLLSIVIGSTIIIKGKRKNISKS